MSEWCWNQQSDVSTNSYVFLFLCSSRCPMAAGPEYQCPGNVASAGSALAEWGPGEFEQWMEYLQEVGFPISDSVFKICNIIESLIFPTTTLKDFSHIRTIASVLWKRSNINIYIYTCTYIYISLYLSLCICIHIYSLLFIYTYKGWPVAS